jgi:hypothetical protein
MRTTICALALLAVVEVPAAPAPLPRREKPPIDRYVEIDFSPMDALAPGSYEWDLWTVLRHAHGGRIGFRVDERNGPASAEIVARRFSLHVERWVRAAVAPCGKKVVLKGRGLVWVELTLTGLPASAKPRVRWVR